MISCKPPCQQEQLPIRSMHDAAWFSFELADVAPIRMKIARLINSNVRSNGIATKKCQRHRINSRVCCSCIIFTKQKLAPISSRILRLYIRVKIKQFEKDKHRHKWTLWFFFVKSHGILSTQIRFFCTKCFIFWRTRTYTFSYIAILPQTWLYVNPME